MHSYTSALILGYGRSGKAAEALLQSEGCETVVLAGAAVSDAEVRKVLEERAFDVCIVSPGFAIDHPWLDLIRGAGIPLLSELELGWSRHGGKTVAVTGSNGKSTAVKWICEMLQAAGYRAEIGGNYGIPACEVVQEHSELDWLVLEVSSFQLETVQRFRPDVGVILNVLPNHLDRHETMELYRDLKLRIYGPEDDPSPYCLIPEELLGEVEGPTDAAIESSDFSGGTMSSSSGDNGDVVAPPDVASSMVSHRSSKRPWITFGGMLSADFSFRDQRIYSHNEEVLDLDGTLFESPVLGSCTGAAVAAVASVCGVAYPIVQQSARGFCALPHRLQKLGEIDGISYVNDSKATNLAAMVAALSASGKKIRLIAGGLPKETDFTFVKEILAERVRSIYLVGQASRAMYHAWNGVCRCEECGSLDVAFKAATDDAEVGDTVLLSPACASFDQFRSFEERGETFEKLFNGVKSA
jgi:UDP-N-acetylmuramoylalanine--D-glutamate ligase